MKELYFVIFLLSQALMTFGQSDTIFLRYDANLYNEEQMYEVDTFVFSTPQSSIALVGTTVIPGTTNQQIAKGYGLYLDAVNIGTCDQSEEALRDEEVSLITETDSSLIISAKIIGNCCHDFLCDVQIVDETTINLIYQSYGQSYCACVCCYGLTYEFSLMKFKNYDSLEFVTLNGYNKTLTRLRNK